MTQLSGGSRLGPLRERQFALLFTGQLVSLAGTAMAPIALAFGVLEFGSATDLGIVLAATWEELHGAGGWGLVVAAEGVGLIAAGLVALRRRPRRALLVGCLALLPAPLFMAALAVPLSLAGVAAAGVVTGFGLELFNVLWITVLQQRIPDDVLARVNSYDALGSFVFIPLGLTVAGPVAAAVGVSTALWSAAAIALAAVLLPLFSRDVLSLRRLEEVRPLPPRETEPLVPPAVQS